MRPKVRKMRSLKVERKRSPRAKKITLTIKYARRMRGK